MSACLVGEQAVGEVVQPPRVGLGAVPLPLALGRLPHAPVRVRLAVVRRARHQGQVKTRLATSQDVI